jgi:flavorubredoxin
MLLIIYDSISGNTEKMANFIAEGAQKKFSNVYVKKVNEVVEEDLVKANIIAFGCPTYNRDLTSGMKSFFETKVVKVKNKLRGKMGVAFGAYGWSGEAIKVMKDNMKYIKMKVLDIHQDFTGTPDEDFYITSLADIKEKSYNFGVELTKKVKSLKKKLNYKK